MSLLPVVFANGFVFGPVDGTLKASARSRENGGGRAQQST